MLWIRTPQVPGSRTGKYKCKTLSTELLTNYHQTSITKLSVLYCVWKTGEGFPDWV